MATTALRPVRDYVGGRWIEPKTAAHADVLNPATGDLLARVPMGGAADVDAAVGAARAAFPAWRDTPVVQRARYLFKVKALLEAHFEEHRRASCTTEHGKTLDESRGSVRRGIENVEVACGTPVAHDGLRPREHLDRHRLRDHPPADRRLRRDRAVQLPADGAALVPAVRGRDRATPSSSSRPSRCRSRSSASSSCSSQVRPAARRRQPRQRRPRGRRRDLRPPRHPRRLLRRLDAVAHARLPARGRRAASASRRSAAPRTSSSSCPTPTGHARSRDHHRVRSTAAPASAASPAACSSPSATPTSEARERLRRRARRRSRSATGSSPASRWARSSRAQHREQVARLHREGRRRGGEARPRRPRA